MKLDNMHLSTAEDYSRAVVSYDDKTKIEVYGFITPETIAAIERDACNAAARALNLQQKVAA